MKKFAILLAAMLLLTAAGCDLIAVNGAATTVPPSEAPITPEPTLQPTEAPTPEPTPTPTPEPTPPGVLEQGVYSRFEAVGFSGQRDGNPTIGKWDKQIKIQVTGKPNEADRKALSAMLDRLRATAGVPEILLVTTGGNFVVGYLPESQGNTIIPGYSGSGAAGYADPGAGEASVMIPDGLTDQPARDGAVAHWVLLGMGLAQGQAGSGDGGSALDQGSTSSAPSEEDWLMLSLLYGSGVKAGMAAQEAMPLLWAYDPAQAIAPDSANNPAIGKQAQIEYFNEVGFYWGNSSSGSVSKWASPIKLEVSGEPTAAQRELLDSYVERITAIEGFPGIERVDSGGTWIISFRAAADLKSEYPAMASNEFGYFAINRAKGGKIAKCVIGAATDFEDAAAGRTQFLRMLMRALGFEHTSDGYPDSVFNYSAHVQDWAALDWKMAEFLYRPDVKPGEKREAVIKKLRQ